MGVSAYRMEPLANNRALIMRTAGVNCAIPLTQVVETMRPLPIKPLAALPDWISGMSIVRGAPVPVIALAIWVHARAVAEVSIPSRLEVGRDGAFSERFVILRVGSRRVALLVDEVTGIAEIGRERFAELPPLFNGLNSGAIEAIGQLDAELLLVIRSARLVPENVWHRIESAAEAAG